MLWSFDDLHIGQKEHHAPSLKTRLISRPRGLINLEWFNFAAEVCKYMNREPKNDDYIQVIKDLTQEFRDADLPYGSKAYEKATELLRKSGVSHTL